jgi:hypothetical protein
MLRTRKSARRTKLAHVRGRGRPTLSDADLIGRRDKLVYALETYWPQIGWQLRSAHKTADLCGAFEPLRGETIEGRISIFLRSVSEPSNPVQIRKTRLALAKALAEEVVAQKVYEDQKGACQLADAAVHEGSREHRLSLKKEITLRRGNVRELEIDAIAREKDLSNAALVLKKREEASRPGRAVDLAGAQVTHRGAEGLHEKALFVLENERKILHGLRERLDEASPPRIALAKKIASERKKRLQQLQKDLAEAVLCRERIEKSWQGQQAGFAQTELVRFIQSRRAAHNPRSLASAMAGLPEISARVSFRRCQKFPFVVDPSLNFEVFAFIERCLKKRMSLRPAHILELFYSEIRRIPKTQNVGGTRIENFLRKRLEDNWWALKAAIKQSLKSKYHPVEFPYALASDFLRTLSKPLTSLDRLLIDDEKLGI